MAAHRPPLAPPPPPLPCSDALRTELRLEAADRLGDGGLELGERVRDARRDQLGRALLVRRAHVGRLRRRHVRVLEPAAVHRVGRVGRTLLRAALGAAGKRLDLHAAAWRCQGLLCEVRRRRRAAGVATNPSDLSLGGGMRSGERRCDQQRHSKSIGTYLPLRLEGVVEGVAQHA